jgi:hypothetical protein
MRFEAQQSKAGESKEEEAVLNSCAYSRNVALTRPLVQVSKVVCVYFRRHSTAMGHG